jgi:hypothetical protein
MSFVFALVFSVLAACGGSEPTATSPTEPTARAPEAEKHAPADVVPGSHEDWCVEHAVPESQCTRCNPSLIAAFEATGDWCEEHGLPESQCLKCNPDLKIERPPKPTR